MDARLTAHLNAALSFCSRQACTTMTRTLSYNKNECLNLTGPGLGFSASYGGVNSLPQFFYVRLFNSPV